MNPAYSHRHTEGIVYKSEEMTAEIGKAIDIARKWVEHARVFSQAETKDWMEVLQVLAERLPDKYLPKYLVLEPIGKDGYRFVVRLAPDAPRFMWAVYKDLTKAVWMGDFEERTRVNYMTIIHNSFEVVKLTTALLGV